MSRLSEIYDGWKNLIFENPAVEEEAKRRMKICVGCPKLGATNVCKICLCYMPAKTRSPESFCEDKPRKW